MRAQTLYTNTHSGEAKSVLDGASETSPFHRLAKREKCVMVTLVCYLILPFFSLFYTEDFMNRKEMRTKDRSFMSSLHFLIRQSAVTTHKTH